ncbi:MAG: hypothetical protein ACK4N5_09390 [Myxococcales bacterium]
MPDALQTLAAQHDLQLPDALHALLAAAPEGLDLGTVRLLGRDELASDALRAAPLSPALLPFAVGGETDAFAMFVPPEPGTRAQLVCAVSLQTGVYAPIASDLRGFGAWLLLLRRAQAALPAGPGFAVTELLNDTVGAARTLAKALDLEPLITAQVEPDPAHLATALLGCDRSSPWACSTLARFEEDPKAALKVLSPALSAASFSTGLLEQAGDLLLTAGETKRAVSSIASGLSRLEPGLQAAPYKLDEPDEETGSLFEPLYVGAAFRFLQEHVKDVTPQVKQSAVWSFLEQSMGPGFGCSVKLEPAAVIDYARKRAFAGDPPGGRWALHLAFGELFGDPDARRAIAEELVSAWKLAGRPWYASRFEQIARAPAR